MAITMNSRMAMVLNLCVAVLENSELSKGKMVARVPHGKMMVV